MAALTPYGVRGPAVADSARCIVVQYYDPLRKDWYLDDSPCRDLGALLGLYNVLENCGVRLHATPYEVGA